MTIDMHMAYVAYCADCQGMVAAVVDDPSRRRGKDGSAATVAEWLRDGDRVERVTCQFVRENLKGCTETCGCKWCLKKRGVPVAAAYDPSDAALRATLLALDFANIAPVAGHPSSDGERE